MADVQQEDQGHPRKKYKDLADGSYAEYVALEPGSITPPGGTASAVTISDATTPAQQAAVSAAGRLQVELPAGGGGLTDTQLRASPVPVSGTFWQATQPVSLSGTVTTDVSDRSARLLGHVTVDNASIAVTGTFWQATQPISGTVSVSNFPATQPISGSVSISGTPVVDTELTTADLDSGAGTDTRAVVGLVRAESGGGVLVGSANPLPVNANITNASLPVTGTFWQATQPVSMATNTPDVTDRAARLLGHVTVDNASIAVTGTFWQATQPVSGTVTANQGGAPWSENLTQVGGTAIVAKTLPANADGQVALPVYINAQQYATYDVGVRNLATAALTANTAKQILSIEHAATSTKTVRIRRIMVHAIQTTALSGSFDIQITRGTAASSAGTVVTPVPRKSTDPAAEVVVKSLPTITAATIADNIPAGGFAATTTLYSPPVLVYDWQEAGETKPYMLTAGALQSLVINVVSTAAHNLTMTVSVDLSEE